MLLARGKLFLRAILFEKIIEYWKNDVMNILFTLAEIFTEEVDKTGYFSLKMTVALAEGYIYWKLWLVCNVLFLHLGMKTGMKSTVFHRSDEMCGIYV